MKTTIKRRIIFVLVLFFPALANSQYDFRKTNWGMTKEQVLAAEVADFVSNDVDGTISYNGTVNDLECGIKYFFAHDTLVRARYVIYEEHTNKNDYISDYQKLKQLLTDKYGKPDKDRTTWLSNIYKDNQKDWGLAISLGQLAYFSQWDTETTQIWLMLQGDNDEIQFTIEYSSIKYAYLDDKPVEVKQIDEL